MARPHHLHANRVLAAIAACERPSTTAVATQLGCTPSAAGRRLRQLRGSGLIAGDHACWCPVGAFTPEPAPEPAQPIPLEPILIEPLAIEPLDEPAPPKLEKADADATCGDWYVRRQLQLSEDELARWVAAGKLATIQTRDGLRFDRAEVEMVRKHRMSRPTVQVRRPAAEELENA